MVVVGLPSPCPLVRPCDLEQVAIRPLDVVAGCLVLAVPGALTKPSPKGTPDWPLDGTAGSPNAVLVDLVPDLVGAGGHEVRLVHTPDLDAQLGITQGPSRQRSLLRGVVDGVVCRSLHESRGGSSDARRVGQRRYAVVLYC
jgi:hypothetical protein